MIASLTRSRALYWLLLALGVLVIVKRALAIPGLGVDSWAPMLAALEFIEHNASDDLFRRVFFEDGVKFQYPPSSLLYIEPLRAVDLARSDVLNAINLLAYSANAIAVGLLVARLVRSSQTPSLAPTASAATFLIALLYEPIVLGYAIGQIQVFLNLLFTVACLLLIAGADRRSAVALALAAAVKPQFGAILLTQAAVRQWRWVATFLCCLAVIGAVSLWRYGFHSHWSYLDVLRFLSERGEAYHLNASINGIAHRLLGNGAAFDDVATLGILQSTIPPYHPLVALLTKAAAAVFFAIPFAVIWRSRPSPDPVLVFCLAAICFVLFSPIAWIHHYGILLPTYPLLLHRMLASRTRSVPALGMLAASFALTGGRFPQLHDTENWLTLLQPATLVFLGACLLVYLLARQIVTEASARRFSTPSTALAGTT